MKVLTTLFMIGMFTTAVAMADDVDDVKAAVQRYFVAINSGDTQGVFQFRINSWAYPLLLLKNKRGPTRTK
jgi:hypothetical protein